jgi:transcription antitermination factor NusG
MRVAFHAVALRLHRAAVNRVDIVRLTTVPRRFVMETGCHNSNRSCHSAALCRSPAGAMEHRKSRDVSDIGSRTPTGSVRAFRRCVRDDRLDETGMEVFAGPIENRNAGVAQDLTGFPEPAQGERAWFALSVRARHEKVVSQLLSYKGFETFLPLFTRRHQYVRRIREFQLPLFPGYLFCRLDPAARLPILITPGVLRLVGAGGVPIPVDSREVEALQKAVQAQVPMVPHPYWKSGQIGRITSGALSGVEGIVVSANPKARLILSVTLLQRSVLLEIETERVSLVEDVKSAAAVPAHAAMNL